MRATLSICLVVAVLGCAKKADPGGAAAGKDAAAEAPKQSEGEQLGQKENAYVTCLNTFSGDIWHGRQIWMDEFAKGPSPKQVDKGPWYGPLKLPDIKECKAGVAAAAKLPPSLPDLEAAGAAYVAAVETLTPLCAQMRDYFDQGNYKDDKLAAAIEAHPKLLAAWDAFGAADQALGGQVDALEDKIQADNLADVEKAEGKKLHYLHLKMLIDAKQVVRFAAAVNTPFEVDLAPYTTAVTALETSVNDLITYYEAHKDEVEKSSPSYWTMEQPAKDFLKNAKDMMRRKRDNTKFSSGEKMTIEANNAEAVEGHPRLVVQSYNSLIDTSNRMEL